MGEGTGSCCQCGCCKNKKWCKIVAMILLILNTIFIAGIWRATGGVCPFTGQQKFANSKMCPMMGAGMMDKSAMPAMTQPQQ